MGENIPKKMKAVTSHGAVGESGEGTLDTKLVQYDRSLGKRRMQKWFWLLSKSPNAAYLYSPIGSIGSIAL